MRKWTYLVAMLMLTCATTTFTGCIDTDEPAGLEQLRGAKAKLLEAKAVVEAAKVKQVEAEAALKNAEAKAKEAEAQATILRAEYEKAIAEAQSAAVIKQIEAEIARLQAETEAKLAEAEATRQSAAAAELEALVKLEQLKTQLAGLQQKNIGALVENYKNYTADYDSAYRTYLDAVNEYNKAAAGLEIETSTEFAARKALEKDVEDAKQALAEAEAKIQLYTDSLEIAKNMTVDELTAKEEAYLAEKKAYNDSIALNSLALDELQVEKKAEYDKLKDLKDSLTAASTFTVPEYKNETAKGNANLTTAISKALLSLSRTTPTLPGYENGVFSYAKNEEAKLVDENEDGVNDSISELKVVEKWLKTLEAAKRDDNGLIIDSLDDKTPYDKYIAVADSTFKADSLEWSILVKAMNGEKTEPTALITEYMKAVDAYNAKFGEVANAVKAQNDAVDAVKKAESDVAVAASEAKKTELEQAYKDSIYTSELSDFDNKKVIETILKKSDALGSTHYATFISEGGTKTTPARLDLYLDLYAAKADSIKGLLATKTDSLYGEWKKIKNGATTTNYDVLIVGEANKTKDAAIAKDMGTAAKPNKDSKIRKAYKEYTTAVDSIKNLESALASLLSKHGTALDSYKSKLLSEYGQVLSGADTLNHTDMMLSSDAIDCIETKLGAASTTLVEDSIHPVETKTAELLALTGDKVKLHYVGALATSTNISAAEIADLKTTELAEYSVVKTQWENKSKDVWGNLTEARMLPLTEDEITEMGITTGSLYTLMQEKAKKQNAADKLGLNGVIDTLIAEITAHKDSTLQAVIDAAIANVAEEQAAVDAQQEVIKALEQPFKDKYTALKAAQKKANDLYTAYSTVISKLEKNGNYEFVTSEEIKDAVEDAQAKLTEALKADLDALKDAITKAEMALLENADAEALAVADLKYKMDMAEYTMNQAKKFMEMAEEYLNNYIASLAAAE